MARQRNVPHSRARWLYISLAGAICTTLVAGCGGNGTNTQLDTKSETAAEVAQEETTTSSVGSFEASFRIVSEAEDDDGSTVAQKLEFADLVAASDFEAPEGFERLANVCEVGRRRDAVIPGELVVRNTTNGFPVTFLSGITITWPFDRGLDASVAQQFSDGPSCEPSEDTDIVASVEFDIKPAGTNTHEFLIVVRDYFSPRYPKGDSEGLADLRATLHTLYTGWTQTCLSASAPLDGSFAQLDGGSITERAYGPEDLPAC